MQRLPQKKKSNKHNLDEAEKTAKDRYYQHLTAFYQTNERENENHNERIYYVSKRSGCDGFIIEDYDYNKFETFGVVINKCLHLCQEEVFYLTQIGLVKFENKDEEKFFFYNLLIPNCTLYGYLRRSGKIVKCATHLKNENQDHLKDYYLIFSTNDDFKNKSPETIIKCYPDSQNEFAFTDAEKIINEAQSLISKDEIDPKICISFVQGSSIITLSINEINPVNF